MESNTLPSTNGAQALPVIIGENSLDAYARGLDAKLRVAQTLLQSGLLPVHLKSPQAVLATILKGQELGFSPMAACSLINFIQGQATVNAAGMQAKAIQHGGKFDEVEWTDKLCKLKVTRADRKWTREFSFSIDDATRMGLTGKDNWKKMPRQMLYARCVSMACRAMWADVLGGLYGTEEMLDSVGATYEIEEGGEVVNVRTGEIVDPAPSHKVEAPKPPVPTAPAPKAKAKPAPAPEASAGEYVYQFAREHADFPKLVGIARNHKANVGGGWVADRNAWVFPQPSTSDLLAKCLVSAPMDAPEVPAKEGTPEEWGDDDIPFGENI